MGANVLPVPADRPLSGREQGRDHAHQARLARAVGPNQSQQARLAAQRQLTQREVLPIVLAQAFNRQFHRCSLFLCCALAYEHIS